MSIELRTARSRNYWLAGFIVQNSFLEARKSFYTNEFIDCVSLFVYIWFIGYVWYNSPLKSDSMLWMIIRLAFPASSNSAGERQITFVFSVLFCCFKNVYIYILHTSLHSLFIAKWKYNKTKCLLEVEFHCLTLSYNPSLIDKWILIYLALFSWLYWPSIWWILKIGT